MGKLATNFITGVPELDAILATMEDKEIKQAVLKATDATIKNHVQPAWVAKVEEAGLVETGALRDIAKKRRVKRSRTQFGSELFIDRNKLIELRKERGGRIGFDKKRNEPFFYAARFEYGGSDGQPLAPLRTALLGNPAAALEEFRKYLLLAMGAIAQRAKFKAGAKDAGATVYRDEAGKYQKTAGGFASRATVDEARTAGTLFEG